MPSTQALIDIGVNLTHRSFAQDLDTVIASARAAGIVHMVLTGTSIAGSQRAEALARKHKGLMSSTAGVHPHDAKSCNDETIDALRELLKHTHVVAVGECGLDYNRDFSPRDVQRRWFEEQLKLAVETQLPIFLHERDAHEDFHRILSTYRDDLVGGVVHCFTGSEQALDAYLALDMHIGITGWICDERRGKHLFDLAKKIPSERLMIETDAPFLMPRVPALKSKGRRNEPAFLPYVAQAVASARNETAETIASTTTETARAFFNIATRR